MSFGYDVSETNFGWTDETIHQLKLKHFELLSKKQSSPNPNRVANVPKPNHCLATHPCLAETNIANVYSKDKIENWSDIY